MESIRTAIETASGYLAEHPEAAAGTDAAATAVREEGLRFRVEGPNGDLISDMSKTVGGGATAPTPGWLLRAALASCDATTVAMEAARDGVDLTATLSAPFAGRRVCVKTRPSLTVRLPRQFVSGIRQTGLVTEPVHCLLRRSAEMPS